MIAHMTQIVHNDILVKELSAHDHSKCKCGTSSAKKKNRKTINWTVILLPHNENLQEYQFCPREVWYFVFLFVLTNLETNLLLLD